MCTYFSIVMHTIWDFKCFCDGWVTFFKNTVYIGVWDYIFYMYMLCTGLLVGGGGKQNVDYSLVCGGWSTILIKY